MRRDHKVTYLTAESIKEIAEKVRAADPNAARASFSVTDLLRKMTVEPMLKTGKLKIEWIKPLPKESPAYVSYKPTTLHVDHEVWDEADALEPSARYILAHEMGHIILHDYNAQPFSEEKQKWIMNEESAEWQANTFAEFFLISDKEVSSFVVGSQIAIHCGVEGRVANRRLANYPNFTGEACSNCGNFTVTRKGFTQSCRTCGAKYCS